MDEKTLMLLAIFLLGLIVILAVVLLALQIVNIRKNQHSIHTLSEKIIRDLEDMEDGLQEQYSHQREELMNNLHQMHSSLVNTFGNISQSYGDYIGEVLQQNDRYNQQNERNMQIIQAQIADCLKRMETQIGLLTTSNSQQLQEIRATVEEKLNATLEKRLNASFSQVSERLEQVYKSLGQVHSLAGGVTDLKRMLSNVKTRGVWGEVQLGSLLSEVMTEGQYKTNVMVVPGSGERVEFAVCLPGKGDSDVPVYLPIDSKFPQEDFARLNQAAQNGDAVAVADAQKALMNSVKTEAKRIGKYIMPPYSTDFAIMFLPLESLYAEVMNHMEAVEAIRRDYRVIISGPSTLVALLNSLQMGFRTLAIEKRSAEVWKLLGAVKSDFRNYSLLLQKTQEKLQQASESVDSAFSKTRTIERRLRNVEAIDGTEMQSLIDDGMQE